MVISLKPQIEELIKIISLEDFNENIIFNAYLKCVLLELKIKESLRIRLTSSIYPQGHYFPALINLLCKRIEDKSCLPLVRELKINTENIQISLKSLYECGTQHKYRVDENKPCYTILRYVDSLSNSGNFCQKTRITIKNITIDASKSLSALSKFEKRFYHAR